jgi:hypothetical protein
MCLVEHDWAADEAPAVVAEVARAMRVAYGALAAPDVAVRAAVRWLLAHAGRVAAAPGSLASLYGAVSAMAVLIMTAIERGLRALPGARERAAALQVELDAATGRPLLRPAVVAPLAQAVRDALQHGSRASIDALERMQRAVTDALSGDRACGQLQDVLATDAVAAAAAAAAAVEPGRPTESAASAVAGDDDPEHRAAVAAAQLPAAYETLTLDERWLLDRTLGAARATGAG